MVVLMMIAVVADSCSRKGSEKAGFQWNDLPLIPPVEGKMAQPGLSGPVAGAAGNFLLIAGGANFEDGMPWRGGTKSYHDEIFLLAKKQDGSFEWKQAKERLPFPMAYPACLSMPLGILSIGGENDNGPVRDVFLMTVTDGKVSTGHLPSLPVALTSPGATSAGNTVFVAGGLESAVASRLFITLDLDSLSEGWQRLPELPVAMSHSVVIAQNDGTEECIYVFGGRNKTTDVHAFFSNIWKYSPSRKTWTFEGDILGEGKPLALAAGTGIAVGNDRILLFGGDPGIYFNQTERLNNAIATATNPEKQKLLEEKDTLLTNHPGFIKAVLAYNTVTKSWAKTGEIPVESPATTAAFYWGDMIIIPSGEIRPGIGTPHVLALKLR